MDYPHQLSKVVHKNEICFSSVRCYAVFEWSIIFVLVYRLRRLSIGNTLILHLTVADFLVSLSGIPHALTVLTQSPLASSYLCELTAFSHRFSYFSSIHLLTILTACRCYGVARPFKYRLQIRRSRVNKACLGAWLFSLIFASTSLLGWGEYEVIDGQCWCAVDSHKHPIQWMVTLVMFYILPTIINSVMFIATAVFIKTRSTTILTTTTTKKFPSTRNKISRTSTTSSSLQRSDGIEVYPEGVHGTFTSKSRDKSPRTDKTLHSENPNNSTPNVAECCSKEIQQSPLQTGVKSAESEVEHKGKQQTCQKIRVQVDINTCRGHNSSADDIFSTRTQNKKTHKIHYQRKSSKIEIHLETINEQEACPVTKNIEEDDKIDEENKHRNKSKLYQGTMTHIDKQQKGTAQQCPTNDHDSKDTGEKCNENIEEHESCSNKIKFKEDNRRNDSYETMKLRHETSNQKQREDTTINQFSTGIKDNTNTTDKQFHVGKSPKKDLKMLILVLLFSSYAVLCGPSFFVKTIYAIIPSSVPDNAFLISSLMNTLNALTNPFLYGLMSNEIRTELRKLLCFF